MLCIVGWGVKKNYYEKFFDMALGGDGIRFLASSS